jgi:hypothetical protein
VPEDAPTVDAGGSPSSLGSEAVRIGATLLNRGAPFGKGVENLQRYRRGWRAGVYAVAFRRRGA